MMASIKELYIKGFSVGVLGMLSERIGGFVNVILITQSLSKEAFGDYAFVYSIILLLAILGGGGLQNLTIYKVSKLFSNKKGLVGSELCGYYIFYSLIIGFTLIFLVFAIETQITIISGKAYVGYWLKVLSVLIPILSVKYIYRELFKANQKISESILGSQIAPALLRILFLLLVWVFGLGINGVAIAIILSELLPLCFWVIRVPLYPKEFKFILSVADVKYSLRMIATIATNRTNSQLDILMIGFFATSAVTADYVIAARLAILALFGFQLLNRIFAPRIGQLLSLNNIDTLRKEYEQIKVISFSMGLLVLVVVLLFGKWILALFGDYLESYDIILILSLAHLTKISFGSYLEYLKMSGYSKTVLLVTLVALFLNLLLNFILIPYYEAVGAALSLLCSFIVVSLLGAYYIKKIDSFLIISKKTITTLVMIFVLILYNIVVDHIPIISSLLLVAMTIYTMTIFKDKGLNMLLRRSS